MEQHSEIVNWLRKMGFDGEIPETLSNICNNSTSFIWDQLILNAKPRQEVAEIRDNILIHRLNSKPIDKQNEFSYPMKEIDSYLQKSSLETKLKNMQFVIKEKKSSEMHISKSVKLKCITVEKLNAKIKENEEREYLLQKKNRTFEKDIQQAEEILSLIGNLTPAELEGKPNTTEISQTLQECAKKLEAHLKQYPASVKKPSYHDTSRPCLSTKKSYMSHTVSEKYVVFSEKSLNTTKKDFLNHNSGKVTKCLFAEDVVDTTKTNKRESFGIISDSCLMDGGLFGEESVFLPSLPNVLPSVEFNSPLVASRLKKIEVETSVVGEKNKKEFLDKIYKSQVVTKELRGLLQTNNRQIIWNTFQDLHDNLHQDIGNKVVFELAKKSSNKGIDRSDINQLRFLHVQTELQILKHKAIAKNLAQQVDKKKSAILVTINSNGSTSHKTEELKKTFDQLLKDVSLDATMSAMKQEISKANSSIERSDLQIVSRKLTQVKDNISSKMNAGREYIEVIQDILTLINNTRNSASSCVRKLVPFIGDMSWSAPLTDSVCSEEIKTFEKFPLEYNRRCIHLDSPTAVYFRDICTDNIPSDLEIDNDNLYMLAEILESPFSFPETVLLNLLRAKLKLDVLKSMKTPPKNKASRKYSFEELQQQESYIQFALDRFNSLINSSSSKTTLSSAKVARKVVELWFEMPFRDFISPQRKFEDQNYLFYENQYDGMYNNLRLS